MEDVVLVVEVVSLTQSESSSGLGAELSEISFASTRQMKRMLQQMPRH